MIKNGKTYLTYEGYEEHFGMITRPALVRYEEHSFQDYSYQEPIDYVSCTIYIDGKSFADNIKGNYEFNGKPYSIALLKPFQSHDKELQEYNLAAHRFDASSVNDWELLFEDSYKLHKAGDPLAYALIVIAFDKFAWTPQTIQEAMSAFDVPEIQLLFDMINYLSWALSPNKINQVHSLNRMFGKECNASFPPCLKYAAERCKILYSNLNVYGLVDAIENAINNTEFNDDTGILKLYQWLNNDSTIISYQELSEYYPYLDEWTRARVIKRFFFDVKKGVFEFDEETIQIFTSLNAGYYSTLRYVLESWPDYRNVSTEFVLDCLNTYKNSNQQSFQVYNGILDWAMQKSKLLHRPVDLYFYDWLCYCQGGVILNPQFRGFADFKINYELDEFAFDEDSLDSNIKSLRDNHSTQQYHEEHKPVIDETTGLPQVDEKGNPIVSTIIIWEDRWRIRKSHDQDDDDTHKKYIDMFVNWSKRPEYETDENIFTSEMIDPTIVRANIEQYILNRFGTLSPYVFQREEDEVMKLFMYKVAMKAILDGSAELGVSPGVEASVVKESVKERLIEIMGESLECEYDPTKLRLAQTDSQYRFNADETKCFIRLEKKYRRRRRIYCAPTLSDKPNLLTKRKCAICQGDMCFVTSISKSPHWSNYKLIHLLEILGYDILEETEAGFIPSQTYNQFVNQINKAVRFYNRLICRECGHILFPATNYGHSKYKCLSPLCKEYNKEVYLNFCHVCKKGLIDSRDTKKCPNDLYICPDCGSCCSNDFFESMADRYRRQGITIPLYLSSKIGQGHADRHMIFCHKCGTRKVDVREDANHSLVGRCPQCEPKDSLQNIDGLSIN